MTMDYEKITDEILAVDDAVNYVGIVDREGRIAHSKTKKGKSHLVDEKEEKVLGSDLGVMKAMQGLYNDSMGKVTCMLTVRERVHQLVFFANSLIFYVSCERDLNSQKIMEIKANVALILKRSAQ